VTSSGLLIVPSFMKIFQFVQILLVEGQTGRHMAMMIM